MLKKNIWKLILSFAIILWAMSSLIPIKDRPFDQYAQKEASAKTEEFNTLMDEARAQADNNRTSIYVALRDIANSRKIDLTQYFPHANVEKSVTNVEKRNALIMEHLLKEAKARLQLGLDLKGGVAFTLEIADQLKSGGYDNSEKLNKAIQIIGDRINAMGLVEPIIRAVGTDRIEVQLPGVNTKDNPEVVDTVKKTAFLTFHEVHPTLRPSGENDPNVPTGYKIMALEEDARGRTSVEYLFIRQRPSMGGADIADSFPATDEFGRFSISLQFTKEGQQNFARITRQIVEDAAKAGTIGRLAIVLDGKLYSAPTVKEEINSGSAQISGSFTAREAQDLANVLNNPLEVELSVKEQYEVGPSLAEDAISSGVRAAIIGSALVAAFMLVFYSTGGLVAVATLAMNVIIIFGIMASFGATLTLPGLAGIVLTIGMAVDANILIFERMREEIAGGKTLHTATRTGFNKALWTILDAHIVQLIVCGVMISLGTGPIKGFGVTLAIGVISTLFSVLITSHMVMEMLVESKVVKKITMRHLIGKINVDFVRFGKPAFIGSWLIVLMAVGVVIYKGDRIYGIDFTGGDVISMSFSEKIDVGEVRRVAEQSGVGEINVTYTSAIGSEQEVLRVETAVEKGNEMYEALKEAYPNAGIVKEGESFVGASIGKEIQWNALKAIAISMLVILIYIAFRFEFGFGIGAMVSSTHDILMTIGIFVLFGHHFSAPMVAAILAVAGYSINETVVVFDRIREELKLNPNATLRSIVNSAINKVFARTIMTTATTFLAAISLFLFGGGVLQDIAFTFMVGILTSTFSAIFISSQVFYWWHRGDRKRVEAHQDSKPTYEWDGASNAS